MSAAALAMMLMVSVHICYGKISLTYAFPNDSCVSDPYLVDEDTMFIMKFEVNLGSQECRQMSFTTPKSAFYSYTMCMKELYFSSPQCQSKVYCRWYWSNYDYDNNYEYNSEEISREGCLYDINRMFSRCLNDCNQVSFELRKSKKGVPDNVNDTFKFQMKQNGITIVSNCIAGTMVIQTIFRLNIADTANHYYEMIGGLSGGIVGTCIFTGVGIYLCINCRRRKRVTGRYCGTCPTCPTYIHSCLTTIETVDTSTDSDNKWETITGFKDQDTAPLCDS